MGHRYAERADLLELMDDPALSGAVLSDTLRDLERLNFFGGHRLSLAGIRSVLPGDARHFTVLDVGTGGGDLARQVVHRARQRGATAKVHGIDLSAATIQCARERCADTPGITLETADLFHLPDQPRYDVVHAALCLHHIPGARAADALRKMHALCRHGVVINDLQRHRAAYWGIRLATRVLARSPLVRHDGPVSVLRAFTRRDLERLANEAGLPQPRVRSYWAHRWLATWQR